MDKRRIFVFVLAAVFCISMFSGCATTPKKELEEKDMVIQDLNSRISSMSQEIENLKAVNRQLENSIAGLQGKIKDLERAAQQKIPATGPNEPNLK